MEPAEVGLDEVMVAMLRQLAEFPEGVEGYGKPGIDLTAEKDDARMRRLIERGFVDAPGWEPRGDSTIAWSLHRLSVTNRGYDAIQRLDQNDGPETVNASVHFGRPKNTPRPLSQIRYDLEDLLLDLVHGKGATEYEAKIWADQFNGAVTDLAEHRGDVPQPIELPETAFDDTEHLTESGLNRMRNAVDRALAAFDHGDVLDDQTPPEAATEAAPANAGNTINIYGDVIGSTIQQGVSRSSQRIDPTITHEERGDVEAFIGAVTRARQNDELELDGEDEADLDSQLSTLQDQLRSPHPSRTIIKTALSIIGGLIVGVAGNALYHQIPAWVGG